MDVWQLDEKEYRGREYRTSYASNGFYEIKERKNGFDFVYRAFPQTRTFELHDTILSDWLEEPVLYGAFEENHLIGFAEGFLEKWNNRFRISNICVLEESSRRRGAGRILMERMLQTARRSGARMAVLETQSCNERAIAFYRRMGFAVIGFDLYAYSNEDPKRQEVRIEMGRCLL